VKTVTINAEQKLYVIPCDGGGCTCLGFDVCLSWTQAYAAAMGETLAIQPPYGTIEAYNFYREVEARFCKHPAAKATFYDPGTPDEVRRILDNAHNSHTRLRLYYGDRNTGLDWGDDACELTGTIGRSMGPVHIPLLIKTARSSGGGAILSDSIVKIETTGKGKRTLYQHPEYHREVTA